MTHTVVVRKLTSVAIFRGVSKDIESVHQDCDCSSSSAFIKLEQYVKRRRLGQACYYRVLRELCKLTMGRRE